jgi:hypothetical protein
MTAGSENKAVRPVFLILLIISVAVAPVLIFSAASGISLRDNVYPSITPEGDDTPVNITNSFIYHGYSYSVTIPVGKEILTGAVNARKEAQIFKKSGITDTLREYYAAFIFDPAQDRMYSEISSALREIKTTGELSDSEYVDLMAAFVQSVPYRGNATDTGAGFPVETLAYGGDCDSRSALLTGMLAHEGYNVSMLMFPKVRHTAVGVASEGDFEYNNSGYTYIETTTVSPVGFIPDIVTDAERYYVIPYGKGDRRYSPDN